MTTMQSANCKQIKREPHSPPNLKCRMREGDGFGGKEKNEDQSKTYGLGLI